MITDTQLQTSVFDELKLRPSVNSAHIGVTATNGVIALTGRVVHFAEKTAAEDAAKSVYGVQDVANKIAVEIVDLCQCTDQEIAAAALNATHIIRPFPGTREATAKGRAAPTAKLAAEASAARIGCALCSLENPSSSRACALSAARNHPIRDPRCFSATCVISSVLGLRIRYFRGFLFRRLSGNAPRSAIAIG